MSECRNAFLIRDPELVLASYTAKRGEVDARRHRLCRSSRGSSQREADRLGRAPPVVEAIDVLRDPRGDPVEAVRCAWRILDQAKC